MRNILARKHREILEQITSSNVLVGLDFDGTLSPIVADPNRAIMRARTRQLLRAVSELYPVVIISGRAQSDVVQRLGGVQVQAVVGNHGLEPFSATASGTVAEAKWRRGCRDNSGSIAAW